MYLPYTAQNLLFSLNDRPHIWRCTLGQNTSELFNFMYKAATSRRGWLWEVVIIACDTTGTTLALPTYQYTVNSSFEEPWHAVSKNQRCGVETRSVMMEIWRWHRSEEFFPIIQSNLNILRYDIHVVGTLLFKKNIS